MIIIARKQWRTAVYLRLSKEDTHWQEESNSIQNQKNLALTYLAKHSTELKLSGIYIDDGSSGTDIDREGFQQLLTDIAAKKIDCVIFKDLSRLSRNYAQAGYLLDEYFVRHQIRYISLMNPAIDSWKDKNIANSMYIPIQNVFNDEWARATSIKVRSVLDMKRQNGLFIGSFAPYGYQKSPDNHNQLIIDETAAAVVRLIFQSYLSGIGMGKIAQKLNALQIPSPSQYKKEQGLHYVSPQSKDKLSALWSASSIRRILKNQVYIGNLIQKRQQVLSYKVHQRINLPESDWIIVKNTHPAIIQPEDFWQVQTLLAKQQRSSPNQQQTHLFSGLLYCADCGRPLTHHMARQHSAYRCSTYTKKGKAYCSPHSIREAVLSQLIIRKIQEDIKCHCTVESIIDVLSAAKQQQNDTFLHQSIAEKEKQLQNIKHWQRTVYEDWKQGYLSQTEYQELFHYYQSNAKVLNQEIKQSQLAITNLSQQKLIQNQTIQYFIANHNIQTLDRPLLLAFIQKIIVYQNNKIEIYFHYSKTV